jgi:hypothetical protein
MRWRGDKSSEMVFLQKAPSEESESEDVISALVHAPNDVIFRTELAASTSRCVSTAQTASSLRQQL